MNNHNIIIFSHEGLESNTEVNFFEGLAIALDLNLKIIPIGKQKKGSQAVGRIERLMDKHITNIDSIIKHDLSLNIFFIGDGDNNDDIPAMERCKNTVIKYLKNIYPFLKDSITSKLIYETNLAFDGILNQHPCIKKSNLISHKTKKHKKCSNKAFYNNIMKACLGSDEAKYPKKQKQELNNIFQNTNYEQIFKILCNCI